MTPRTLLVLPLLLAACGTPLSGEKGPARPGLVSVRVDSGELDKVYQPRRFALLIGIGEYADEAWRDLQYARKDAEDFAGALKDPVRGRFDDVRALTSPEDTTRAGVLAAIRQLRMRATRPDDVVVVYVSGHGTLARDVAGELRRYLVTQDAKYRDIVGSALSMDALKREFELLPSKRRLLVLATCHSGTGKSLLPPEIETELSGIKAGFYTRPLEAASRASMVFSASDWGETAREDESLRNDIYTHFLLEALNGAGDRNEDGAVTATEAHDYARRRTFAFTEGRQRPSAEILEVGSDPIVLAGEPIRGGRPELFSYSARLEGFTLKVDGEPRTELPGGTAVAPGKRTIQLAKGGHVLIERAVDVAPGERLDLEELAHFKLPHRTVSLVGGIFSLIDPASRAQLLPPFGVGGVSFRYDGLPARSWSLLVDATGGTGSQQLRLDGAPGIPFRFRHVGVGASVLYGLRAGRFGFFAGPRVAGLWMQRSFSLDLYREDQNALIVSPGVLGSLTFGITERFELALNAQVMGAWLSVDGAGRFEAISGASAGVGYRF